jgi:hypothetical protein
VTPSPAPENAHNNLGATLLPPPDSNVFSRERCCLIIFKNDKRGRKVLNLISFKFGALGGKLMLITSFLSVLDSFKAQMKLSYL